MKTRGFFIIFLLAVGLTFSYSQSFSPQQGDELVVKLPEKGAFKYLDVPRTNFIMKGGGILDMDRLNGAEVVVEQVRENRRGTQLVLKRKDGKRFFRSHTYLTASWPEAVENSELLHAD